ncbi:MAG: hypothetical protein OXC62_02945 [Aestuariivita sp.]|nr:hypothetical protein [Aestuariivita sp.]
MRRNPPIIDRAGLTAFCHQSEGELPPVFKGRGAILTTLRKRGAATRTVQQQPGHTQPHVRFRGIPKTTQIVQGAPGAGKSSVLAKLQEECIMLDNESAPRVVITSSQDIMENLPQVLKLIRATGECSPSIWTTLLSRVGVNLTTNALGEISATIGWVPSAFDHVQTLGQLAEIAPSQNWTAPVIIAVDEAQRISGNDTTPHARFLQSLHDASSGLPLTLVLGGLSDTKERMQDFGITRGVTTHNLGCLNATDRNELMGAFCEKFGINGINFEPELQALAEPTEGWPRHLHFTLQALAQEFLRVNGVMAEVQWQQVAEVAASSRVAYYHHQQSAVLRRLKPLVGAVMEDLRKGDDFDTITSRIRQYFRPDMLNNLSDKFMNPSRFPRDLVHELIHQGALQ